ncbi:MBL fold metallo-hydrolase [Cupriavidus pinatubonensis]|uniref:Ribonuclease BN n=1 Tax=Cupriavidus pinatubonensis TaxID=248026 RepID=A0ABM8XHZ7_9BURK|nr:MBL fold metallo-hydrolase [Cupriavidus pinatubonensis]CAG9179799.1 Ribonuclease BN [Cupriavidus pinatubonensis]
MKKFSRQASLALCLAALASAMACAPASAEELFTVTLLGTGSPRPSPERNGPSTLVEVGGQKLMFDMGRNNTVALYRAHIPLGAITAHFITHLHSDHINGLPDLYLTGWIGTPYAGRKHPFVVYGPKGTQAMMQYLYDAFSEDRRIRHADEHETLEAAAIEAHDIGPGVVYDAGGVKVTAFEVFHGELIQPAYGYKIEYKGHKVVLSGDTRYAKTVEQEGTGADLLVHEVAAVGGGTDKLVASQPFYRAVIDHHITPEDAGRLFAIARPKLAVYSHIVVPGNFADSASEQLIAETRKMYNGPLVVGEDLMRFRISDEAIAMEKL